MAIVLTPLAAPSPSDYFTNQFDIDKAPKLRDMFRRLIADEDAKNNLLDNQEFTFTDQAIYAFLSDAIDDINSGVPKTVYTISGIEDDMFVVRGALVMALVSKGILETKNSLSFSDQGLSINTFDKGPQYQSWAGTIGARYEQTKMEYKSQEVYRSMFCGVRSDYSRLRGRR